jgi:hypothetical protein
VALLSRPRHRPFQIFRRAAQQVGAVLEITDAQVAGIAEQPAHELAVVAMIEAAVASAAEFLSANRASAVLPLEHRTVLLGRDAVSVLEAGTLRPRIDLAPVFWVISATLAPARLDLA